MNNKILRAFEEMSLASNEVCSIKGEINRLSELEGSLSEKVKIYREVDDYDGANAISVILIDDIKSEIHDLYEQFCEAMEMFEQKSEKLKNICAIYGINVQLGNGNKIINFYK